jgi:anhydro-N-acetylmuramic acid kinase
MKNHIQHLAYLSRKSERRIIGLMSGTSLDGLDVALCSVRGAGLKTKVKVLHFETIAYDDAFKAEIRQVFAKKEIDFQHLTLLNVVIAERHASIVNQCLSQWGIPAAEVDLIASHGQTVFHAPRILHGMSNYPNATCQIGDGDHIACRTGIITISDFRQKHLAAGGEGAPLALYGDYYLFSQPGFDRFLLNIGGIANFTFLPASGNPAAAFATDTGPGNTLLDAFARELFGVPFDAGALLASAGRVDKRLLEILKSDPFFGKPFPKTTGPEMFSTAWVKKAIAQLPKGSPNPYDLMATLTRLTAETIADAVLTVDGGRLTVDGRRWTVDGGQRAAFGQEGAVGSQGATDNSPVPGIKARQLYLSGGGAHNPLIVQYLKELLPEIKMMPMKKLGIDCDAKEAVLFAVLANETVAGTPANGLVLGGIPLLSMGKISLPG